jgi:hypothetical protein
MEQRPRATHCAEQSIGEEEGSWRVDLLSEAGAWETVAFRFQERCGRPARHLGRHLAQPIMSECQGVPAVVYTIQGVGRVTVRSQEADAFEPLFEDLWELSIAVKSDNGGNIDRVLRSHRLE